MANDNANSKFIQWRHYFITQLIRISIRFTWNQCTDDPWFCGYQELNVGTVTVNVHDFEVSIAFSFSVRIRSVLVSQYFTQKREKAQKCMKIHCKTKKKELSK